MKKLWNIALLFVLIFTACASNQSDFDENDFTLVNYKTQITQNIFTEGCIRNEDTAILIAIAILTDIYADDFENGDITHGLPMLATFDEEKQVWNVKNQTSEHMIGGSLYVILKKSNAEVVAVWADM